MKKLIASIIGLMPIVCFTQKPYSDYVVTNAGNTINSMYDDMFPTLLHDGLTLFFCSNRPGGFGDLDIYVCTRKSTHDTWSEPKNLGADFNTDSSEHSVAVSDDGHWMLFFSARTGGLGNGDLYLSYRKNIADPFGWGKPKNAGRVVNSSSGWDACPIFHKEHNIEKVYFTSNRKGGLGEGDAYVSSFSNGIFTAPVAIKGINTAAGEMHFAPSEGFVWTNRKGGYGKEDLWISNKRKGMYEWEQPVNLGPTINTSSNEGMPTITSDKSLFAFHSDRPGGNGKSDIFFARPKNRTAYNRVDGLTACKR